MAKPKNILYLHYVCNAMVLTVAGALIALRVFLDL